MNPLARGHGLVVQELEDELLLYDTKRHRAHHLNQTAALIFCHCDGVRTVAELAELLEAGAPLEARIAVVEETVRVLARKGLLKDPRMVAGVPRRKVLKLGAAALALPVIRSIVAPTPAYAQTALPNGAACTASSQCASGCCCNLITGAVCQDMVLCVPGCLG